MNAHSNLLILLALVLSFNSFSTDKSILGEDQRERIIHTLKKPFDHVGHVGQWCSGFLISDDTVITAAHCVYNNDVREFVESSYFRAARNGENTPFDVTNWKSIHVLKKYDGYDYTDGDVALIKLKNPIDVSVLKVRLSIPTKPKFVRITGYPRDKKAQMWSSTCKFEKNETMLEYDCDTLGGMSGSSVLSYSNGVVNIYGIHVLGGKDKNSAVAITSEIIQGANAIISGKVPNQKNWKSYNNKITHFVPEYDEIILKGNKSIKKMSVVYKDFDRNEVKKTFSFKNSSTIHTFKTRTSYFHMSHPSKECSMSGLKLIDGQCYKRISIISTNWGQVEVNTKTYQTKYLQWQ